MQSALKLSVGDDQELLHAILILLGCYEENIAQENVIDNARKQEIIVLLEDTASSHLLEVLLSSFCFNNLSYLLKIHMYLKAKAFSHLSFCGLIVSTCALLYTLKKIFWFLFLLLVSAIYYVILFEI